MEDWKTIDEETNPLDALKIALEMEKKVFEFYKKAMEIAKYPGTREMFKFLMDEEVKHKSIIEEEINKDFYSEM
ncbi:MAG: ferritin family protein [Candidatus Ancaeobacter aquaticus]|nr:ferritin family protein [Candidatus Ancaeobacter aquaticus]